MLINAERHVDMMLLTVNGNSVLTLAIKYNAYSFANYLFANCHHLLGIQGAIDPFDTVTKTPKCWLFLKNIWGRSHVKQHGCCQTTASNFHGLILRNRFIKFFVKF